MQDINSEFIFANKILSKFADKHQKFVERFISLSKSMDIFLEKAGMSNVARVDPLILGYALFNYFEDIMRLKEFHHVGHVNNIKIVSYTSYWLLRMKPIQATAADMNNVYANERFVLSYIIHFLQKNELGNILLRPESGINSFRETMFYYLKYRSINAQTLELMIISFFSGQVYQSKDNDISDSLGKFSIPDDVSSGC